MTQGQTGNSGAQTAIRATVYGAIIVAAIAGVWYATRGTKAPVAAAGGHDHSAMAAAGGSTARPVTLSEDQQRRIGVTYAVATEGAFGRDIRTVGQVTYDETRLRAISLKVDGWVERLFVNATGQPVAAGDALLTIYSPMLVQAQEELLLAKSLSGSLAEATAGARGNADSLVESARRRLAYWDVPDAEIREIERSGAPRKALTMRAPSGGYVLEKNVVAGQKVMAGEALYRVADLREVWVEGDVFEQDLADVRVGLMVHADFPALPGEHRMGRIGFVYPTISPETRTARVRVVLANGDGALKPGMYATLRIVGATRPRVLTVPRDAVLSTGERHVVFVREGSGALVPREVAIGSASDERLEILRGLSAGDTVVASATFLVDAESNLGKAMGGMGDMPGMEMQTPPVPLPMKESPAGAAARPNAGAKPKTDSMAHDMPAMDHTGHDMSTMKEMPDMPGMPGMKAAPKPTPKLKAPPRDSSAHAGHDHEGGEC